MSLPLRLRLSVSVTCCLRVPVSFFALSCLGLTIAPSSLPAPLSPFLSPFFCVSLSAPQSLRMDVWSLAPFFNCMLVIAFCFVLNSFPVLGCCWLRCTYTSVQTQTRLLPNLRCSRASLLVANCALLQHPKHACKHASRRD